MSILFVYVGLIAKAQDSDSVATLYDFAFFAGDENIVISQIAEDDDTHISNKWGVIDTSGNVIVDGKSTWIVPSCDGCGYSNFFNYAGYVLFGKEGSELYGIMDTDYKELIPPTYKDLELFGEYAAGKDVTKPGKVILHIPSKKIVGHVKDTYQVNDISEDMVWVTKRADSSHPEDWKSYMLDMKGNIIISPDKIGGGEIVYGFRDGRAPIKSTDGLLGFVDKKGNIVISPEYDYDIEFFIDEFCDVCNFHNGRAIMFKDDELGVIDKNGDVVIPFGQYSLVKWKYDSEYKNFIVNENYDYEGSSILDNNGKKIGEFSPVIKQGPDEWYIFRDKETGREGYKNHEDKVMLPPIYFGSSSFTNGYALVGIENEGICLIDSEGKILIRRLARRNWSALPYKK